MWLAAFYMSGDAQQWYHQLEKNHGRPEWTAFVAAVNLRFGPPGRNNSLGELIQLRREDSVAEYQSKFFSLLARCDDITESQQIVIFTTGLREPLKTDVELLKPSTLDEAMSLARAYERRLSLHEAENVSTPPAVPGRAVAGRSVAPVKSPPTALTSSSAGTSKAPLALPAPPGPRFKRLTPAEMAAKRERNECYNCTEKFSKEHLKVCPMKGVYLIQMEQMTIRMNWRRNCISLCRLSQESPPLRRCSSTSPLRTPQSARSWTPAPHTPSCPSQLPSASSCNHFIDRVSM